MPKIPYICLYGEYKETFSMLSDEELGCLVRAMLDYWDTGEEVPICGSGNILWPMVRNKMNRDFAAYEKRCDVNRINGAKGGRPKKEAGGQNPVAFSEEEAKPTAISGFTDAKEAGSAWGGDSSAEASLLGGEKTDGFPLQPKEPNYNNNQNNNHIYNYIHNQNQNQSESESQTAGGGKTAHRETVPDNRVEMLEYWKKRIEEHTGQTL